MWAPKYQCGRVKIDQLGAHMAPGVLKLFATLAPPKKKEKRKKKEKEREREEDRREEARRKRYVQ